jgi:hypothetical protein
MAIPAGPRPSHFEIASPINVGGMDEIYKARDTRVDRIVATKGLPVRLAEPI